MSFDRLAVVLFEGQVLVAMARISYLRRPRDFRCIVYGIEGLAQQEEQPELQQQDLEPHHQKIWRLQSGDKLVNELHIFFGPLASSCSLERSTRIFEAARLHFQAPDL